MESGPNRTRKIRRECGEISSRLETPSSTTKVTLRWSPRWRAIPKEFGTAQTSAFLFGDAHALLSELEIARSDTDGHRYAVNRPPTSGGAYRLICGSAARYSPLLADKPRLSTGGLPRRAPFTTSVAAVRPLARPSASSGLTGQPAIMRIMAGWPLVVRSSASSGRTALLLGLGRFATTAWAISA